MSAKLFLDLYRGAVNESWSRNPATWYARENPVWVQMLGLCPAMAVTTSVTNAAGLALATIAVLVGSNLVASAIPIPERARLPALVFIIASFTTTAMLVLEAFAFDLFERIALYVQIIVTNCVILARADASQGTIDHILLCSMRLALDSASRLRCSDLVPCENCSARERFSPICNISSAPTPPLGRFESCRNPSSFHLPSCRLVPSCWRAGNRGLQTGQSPMNKTKRTEIFRRLQQVNPAPTTELEYENGFQLLIAVILSAQATDVSVNKATKGLYREAGTPASMLDLGSEGLKQHISSIGLYNSKTENLSRPAKYWSPSTMAKYREIGWPLRHCQASDARPPM